MSKSRHTQQCYQKVNENQSSLTNLGFMATPSARPGRIPAVLDTIMAVAQTETPSNAVISVAMEPVAASGPSGLGFSTNCTQFASVLSDPSTTSDGEGGADLGDVPEEEAIEEAGGRCNFDEECESDLNEIVQGPSQIVRDWSKI